MKKRTLRLDKIIDATDIDGQKNKIVFEITKRIEKELTILPEFIGVAPFGSATKGYRIKSSDSDIDLCIFEDKKFRDCGERVTDALYPILLEYMKKGVKVQVIEQYFGEKNIKGIVSLVDILTLDYYYLSVFANLCRPSRGVKICFWREELKKEIATLSITKKEKFLSMFVEFLVYSEKFSFKKMEERIADFNEETYADARRKLWIKRIYHILS